MQTFKDTETGQYWQFDDDVLVADSGGALVFTTAHGEVLDVPVTLIAAELPPPEPTAPYVPQVVSRFQGREAMWQTPHGGGSLLEAAEGVISSPETPAIYRRAWDDLQEFHRDSEMLQAVADSLRLTSTDLDALFILAGSIKA